MTRVILYFKSDVTVFLMVLMVFGLACSYHKSSGSVFHKAMFVVL